MCRYQNAPSFTFRVHLVIASFEQRFVAPVKLLHGFVIFRGQQLQESAPKTFFLLSSLQEMCLSPKSHAISVRESRISFYQITQECSDGRGHILYIRSLEHLVPRHFGQGYVN